MGITRGLRVLRINQPQMENMPVLVVYIRHKFTTLETESGLVLGGENFKSEHISSLL
jgi:hypothetical protein